MRKPSGEADARPTALVLSPEAPYPVVGGGPMRTASLLEYLRKCYRVRLITFREPGAPDPLGTAPDWLEAGVLDLPYHSRSVAARSWRNLGRAVRGVPPLVDRFAGYEAHIRRMIGSERFDVGVIEHFWCAPYGGILGECCQRLVLNLHNVESVLLERTAEEGGPWAPVLRRFACCCRDLERRWLPRFSTVLVTSEADRSRVGLPQALVYPNAIPMTEQPCVEKRNRIAFSGNLAYAPNDSAVRWFHERVWPRLRESHPDLEWTLIGRNENRVRARLNGSPQITFTGPVADAVAALAQSRLAVVPVITGSGTRIKIIEAWAAGVPVVSTTIGAEGLPYENGTHLLIADTPSEFAGAVSKVLQSVDLQARLGEAGRRQYEEYLTWDAAWKTLIPTGL